MYVPYRWRITFFGLIAISLSSCNKKSAPNRPMRSRADVFYTQSATGNRNIACQLDIPLPVDARVVIGFPDYSNKHKHWLLRHTSLEQQALLDFYMSMLEQAGWRLIGCMQGSCESLMVWEQPRKLCVVSLRPVLAKQNKDRTKTCITITMCGKKKYQS